MYNNSSRPQLFHSNIQAYATGDVNGDKISDHVYLIGNYTPDSPFVQNITLVIQDGYTGKSFGIPLQYNAGYNPTLFLGDFTGDGVDDILIGITSGGSGGITYYYIITYVNNLVNILFDFNLYNHYMNYQVTYLNHYKVKVTSQINNTTYLLDITYKGQDYLNEIYRKDGTLFSPIDGFVDPLSGLYPVDYDSNQVYELLAYQKISGRNHADGLGYVQNILEWKDNGFHLRNQYIAISG